MTDFPSAAMLSLVAQTARAMAKKAKVRWLDTEDFYQAGLLKLVQVRRTRYRDFSAAQTMLIAKRAMLDLLPYRRVVNRQPGLRLTRAGNQPYRTMGPPIWVSLPQDTEQILVEHEHPEQVYLRKERLQALQVWYDSLDVRSRQIVEGLLRGRTARSLAYKLGLTEARLSQIRAQYIQKPEGARP